MIPSYVTHFVLGDTCLLAYSSRVDVDDHRLSGTVRIRFAFLERTEDGHQQRPGRKSADRSFREPSFALDPHGQRPENPLPG